MMRGAADQPLRAAFWNYDRTMPLVDGRVTVEGAALAASILRPEETFARAFVGDGFDVCELSFSNSVTAASRGELPYVLIPAFLSRAFRHSTIFIRTDRGIDGPADLRGKRIGLQEYDMTAAVVVRGLLRDSYGIEASEIEWHVGDAEQLKPLDIPRNERTAPLNIVFQPPGVGLEDRLLAGELDAIVSLRVPEAITQGSDLVRRLFPDSRAVESAWYAQTRIFPIMHAVGVRRSLAAARPDLVRSIYAAFCAAKQIALDELAVIQAPKVTLPWPAAALADAMSTLSEDFWAYGVEANRHVLETQLRWSWEDGLQEKKVTVEELFFPNL